MLGIRARFAALVGPRRLLAVAAASAATLGFVSTLGAKAEPSSHGWAAGLPGCDPSRPAVAHHADQQVLSDQPGNGPVPCGTLTGWPASEDRIEVTNSGTVIFIPAKQQVAPGVGGVQEGLARTSNQGLTWNAFAVQTYPESQVYPLYSSVDHNLYVDHTTGRLFAYFDNPFGPPVVTVLAGGATVAFSDDSGTTWSVGHDIDHTSAENPTILTGVPTLAVSRASIEGYPNVVYLCGDNTSSGVGGTGTAGFSCSKSLTGGRTWMGTTRDGQGFYSGVVKDHLSPYQQCAGGSSSAGADVQPLSDGTLLVVVSCNGNWYLSESKDEGATWNIVYQLPHGGDLRVDSANNLYLLELGSANGANQLLLSHSTDLGQTWSPELNMIAPGVVTVGKYFFVQGTYAAGQVGHVAVAYYGSRASQTTSDGYITETRDALDSNPLFWSGQVNNPTRPLLNNTMFENQGVNFLDFNGGALSPDGQSVWGSFVQSCGANMLTDPNCQARWPQTNPLNPTDGFAGRLVWPQRDSSGS